MFIFDNDSKTVIARNTPAWQIEYDTGFAGESTHNLDIVTISNGTSYTIEYLADSLSFNKFLSVVKQMISSLQFIAVRPITTRRFLLTSMTISKKTVLCPMKCSNYPFDND